MFSRDVYKDDKAPAYVLLGVTLKKYGLAALEEEPELLRMLIERDSDIKLSDLQADKLQAAICTMLTDQVETHWRIFEPCVHLFNNQYVEHDILTPVEAEEIAVALAEIAMIKNDVLDKNELIHYGEEVLAYAGHVFYEYGMSKAPDIFPDAIMPKCNDCCYAEKNAALKELFNAHVEYILDYLEKLN